MMQNYSLYPQQQSRLNYLESQMAAQQSLLRGRPVASFEEVRAIPIDFDGSIFYFPDAANGKIYTKQIGLNGQAVFRMYQIVDLPSEPTAQGNEQYVSKQEFTTAINALTAQLNSFKQGGGTTDDKPTELNKLNF